MSMADDGAAVPRVPAEVAALRAENERLRKAPYATMADARAGMDTGTLYWLIRQRVAALEGNEASP